MSNHPLLSNNPDEDIAPVSPFGTVDYGVTPEELEQLAAAFTGVTSVENREEFDTARKAVAALRKQRTSIEDRRKTLKADSLAFGRLVDSTAKELVAVIEPEEQRIAALVDEVKARKAKEKAEREAAEAARVEAIRSKVTAIAALPGQLARASSEEIREATAKLSERAITEDEFAELTEQAQGQQAATILELDQLRKEVAHDERIAAKEAEERKAQEAELAAERERIAAEQAKLAEERRQIEAEREAQRQAEAERQAAEEAERRRVAEAEAEEKRKAEEAEAARLAEERRQKLLPEMAKVAEYLQALQAVERPECSEDEAVTSLDLVFDFISSELKKVKAKL